MLLSRCVVLPANLAKMSTSADYYPTWEANPDHSDLTMRNFRACIRYTNGAYGGGQKACYDVTCK